MQRLNAIKPETATGNTKEMMDKIQSKYGMVPNLTRTLANAPAALGTYLGFGALDKGTLPPTLREQIALTVAEINDCKYCLAAHTAIGKMVGLSGEQAIDSRRAKSIDSKEEAALQFAKAVVEKQGWVTDADVANVRGAGYTDEDITEIVAHVVKNIFTNYFNHVAQIEVDFPAAPALETVRELEIG